MTNSGHIFHNFLIIYSNFVEKTLKKHWKIHQNKTILFAIYLLTGALNLPQVQCNKFLFIFIFYRVAVDLNFCPSLLMKRFTAKIAQLIWYGRARAPTWANCETSSEHKKWTLWPARVRKLYAKMFNVKPRSWFLNRWSTENKWN
jgi:hypothetical protein